MSIQSISNNIARAEKESADLSKKLAQESKKISDLEKKIIQIQNSINDRISESTLRSKINEINRKQSDIAKCQKNQADHSKKMADKSKRIFDLKAQLLKEEERERKKTEANEKKRQREQLAHEKRVQNEQLNHQRRITRELEAQKAIMAESTSSLSAGKVGKVEYDIFISHASEDKKDFVEPIAIKLKELGFNVWYDKFTLKIGDSLREKIDEGLANSRYGTIVISTAFIDKAKNWTGYELNSMVAREMNGHRMILPIWHKVSKDDVINFSPALADRLALSSSTYSIDEIAKEIAEVLQEN